MKNDYLVRVCSLDIRDEEHFSFALFHTSSKAPIMTSPYLKDLDEVVRLGQLFADQFDVHFLDPFAPPPPRRVERNFKLIQGGRDEGGDLQEQEGQSALSCDENNLEH